MVNSNEYMNDYMKRRYKERRQRAFNILGNRCNYCETTDNLEIDHVDPKQKSFAFGKIWSYALEKFDHELEKGQLLCYDCHKLKSSLDNGVPHGGGLTGKRNCGCDLCKVRKREYQRRYK